LKRVEVLAVDDSVIRPIVRRPLDTIERSYSARVNAVAGDL
jgi:hypothetical protein